MTSKAILAALHAMEEAPWKDIRGKPLDERGLANRLRQYGVKSKVIRIGTPRPKGIPEQTSTTPGPATSLHRPPQPQHPQQAQHTRKSRCLSQQSAIKRKASHGNPIDNVADVADVALPGDGGRTCAQCGQRGGEFCLASVGGTPLWLHVQCKDHYRL